MDKSKKVTATFEREVDATLQIVLEGEVIETTAEHPFYTQEGWKDAGDLTTIDRIKTQNHQWQRIKGHNFLYQTKKVYNFEVENWHTYFVGLWALLVHNAEKCLSQLFKSLKHATTYGFDSYKNLRKLVKGTGLEVHHLIEKRFAKIFKPPKKAREMLSMVLTKEEHQVFTNAWRKAIPYGTDYSKLTPKDIEDIARKIYKDYPEILKALGL